MPPHTTNYSARSALANYEEAIQDIDLETRKPNNVTLNALDWDGHQKTQLHTPHLGSGQVGLVAILNAVTDHDNTYVLMQF